MQNPTWTQVEVTIFTVGINPEVILTKGLRRRTTVFLYEAEESLLTPTGGRRRISVLTIDA